ncbi:MAG: VPLPA-CTERM sorting domain-containing protein [Gammaproteobacteria bacterium]
MRLTTMTIRLISLFVGGCFSAAVSAATVWVPTSTDVDTTDIGWALSLWVPFPVGGFAVFDDDDPTFSSSEGDHLHLANLDEVRFTDLGGNWQVENVAGATMVLSGSPRFLLAEGDDANGWAGDTGYTQTGLDTYWVEFPGGAVLQGVDMTPALSTEAPAVPLPAAVWLFGGGLIGLVGVARRDQRGRSAGRLKG